MPVTKAVIPAAGLGTRFLPATKAIPKELLPVVDRPALEYIVEEAARAGATDVLIITARGKTALEDHFDRVPEIEAALEKKGDAERLARVRLSTELAKIHFVRQGTAAGLGHAVLVAAEHVGDEPFIVLLGDDMVDPRDPLLETMIAEQERLGGSVIALMEVPEEMVSMYGVATVEPADASGRYPLVKVSDLVEKPPLEEAPSNLAIIGRYLLSPTIFDILRKTEPGRGGEYPADRCHQGARPHRAGAWCGLHRAAVRHRRQDRLHQGGRAARLRARRHRRRALAVAAGVRQQRGPEWRSHRVRTVDQHLSEVLAAVAPLPAIPLPLVDAHGCILAEDVRAAAPIPGFDNSAMDGYAVRLADVETASSTAPVTLTVVGDIAAGSTAGITIQPGFCARIMTGAPIPPGCDAVVQLEWTDGGTSSVVISQAPRLGHHIRRAGEDLAAGDLVLQQGSFLGAAQIGLLAATGRASAMCRPRPRVVVVSTGSELVDVGETPGAGQLPDSNSHMLAAACREAGAMAYRVGLVPDDPALLLETLEDHLIRADLLLTTGGVSVGAYDVVKEVLSRLGTVTFDKVAMQPGMPQGFGALGVERIPIFTLPGNPVSAMVSFEVFVRPALRRMLGADSLLRPQVTAEASEVLSSPPGRRSYLRGIVERTPEGRLVARSAGAQGSHQMAALAAANALLVVPEDQTRVEIGGRVLALLLERRGR